MTSIRSLFAFAAASLSAALLLAGMAPRCSVAAPPASPITVDPNPLDFDEVDVGSTSTSAITITNTSNAAVPITLDLSKFKPPFQASSDAPPPTSLAPGQSFQLTVKFTPSHPGAAKTQLGLTINTKPKKKLKIPITGFGEAVATGLQVSPTTLDFGSIPANNEGPEKTFTVSNHTNQTISFRISPEGGQFGPNFFLDQASNGTGDFSIGPNVSRTFYVGFSSPTAGTFTKVLDITSGPAGHETVQKVTCKAKAT